MPMMDPSELLRCFHSCRRPLGANLWIDHWRAFQIRHRLRKWDDGKLSQRWHHTESIARFWTAKRYRDFSQWSGSITNGDHSNFRWGHTLGPGFTRLILLITEEYPGGHSLEYLSPKITPSSSRRRRKPEFSDAFCGKSRNCSKESQKIETVNMLTDFQLVLCFLARC